MDIKTLHKSTASKETERTLFDTIGDELRKARMSRNLSVAVVAEKLNIKEKYIEALENNDINAFPAPVYSIAFLRSYASFLELDSNALVSEFKEKNQTVSQSLADFPIHSESSVLPDKSVLIGAAGITLALLLLVYGLVHFNEKVSENEDVSAEQMVQLNDLETALPFTTTLTLETTQVLNEQENTEENAEENIVEKENVKDESDENKNFYSFISGVKYGAVENARLVLVAKENVWIDISEKGSSLFSRVLNKGDAYFVSVDHINAALRTGNAKGLDVYVDKNFYGPLSKNEKIKKNVILNPDLFQRNNQ